MKGLKEKRISERWKITDIAKAAGVSKSAVYNWESGIRFPRKSQLDKLCAFFNCNIDDLL